MITKGNASVVQSLPLLQHAIADWFTPTSMPALHVGAPGIRDHDYREY